MHTKAMHEQNKEHTMNEPPLRSSFLEKYRSDYNMVMEQLHREDQFPQLTSRSSSSSPDSYPHRYETIVHLDHAASTIPPKMAVDRIAENWKQNLYSNPHSRSRSSRRTTHAIERIRQKVLSTLFNTTTDEYDLVFTYNATQALKMVGECFPFASGSQFTYLQEAHNSLIGIREYAKERGASFAAVSEEDLILQDNDVNGVERIHNARGAENGNGSNDARYNLFAYAPECNYSGARYNLDWVDVTHRGCMPFQKGASKRDRWFVMLDASKYSSTDMLDLSKYEPDYVCISFYKLFGLPSGLGALLVRRGSGAGDILRKVYFSGGTVMASSSDSSFHAFRSEFYEKFEDGTSAFMNIVSLGDVLDMMPQFGISSMEKVKLHTYALSHFLYEQLQAMRHYNGSKICEVYGKHHMNNVKYQGSILNFNFLRSTGEYVGYSEVEKLAMYNSISIRTGCFCNPGACQTNLKLSARDVKENFENGHVCWDDKDIINGKPTGSIRVSFGYMSTFADLEAFLRFVEKYFVDQKPPVSLSSQVLSAAHVKKPTARIVNSIISHFIIYPVKSCAGIHVDSWELSETGPLFDREWTIVNDKGHALQQKHVPRMASIIPKLDLQARTLVLSSDLCAETNVTLDLDYYPDHQLFEEDMNVCGNKLKGLVYDDEHIITWLTEVMGMRCRLVRKNPSRDRFAKGIKRTIGENDKNSYQMVVSTDKLNFTNEAQFLVVTRASMDAINNAVRERHWIGSDGYDFSHQGYRSSDWLIDRFRPNIVLESNDQQAWEEDFYQHISICDRDHGITLRLQGPCNRCSMVCIDGKTFSKVDEPLKTLLDLRRDGGRALFGVLMAVDSFRPLSESDPLKESSPSPPSKPHVLDRNSVVRVHMAS